MLRRGKKPNWMVCLVAENAPEISACDAITVAAVANTTMGISDHAGSMRKNGFSAAAGLAKTRAPWPK